MTKDASTLCTRWLVIYWQDLRMRCVVRGWRIRLSARRKARIVGRGNSTTKWLRELSAQKCPMAPIIRRAVHRIHLGQSSTKWLKYNRRLILTLNPTPTAPGKNVRMNEDVTKSLCGPSTNYFVEADPSRRHYSSIPVLLREPTKG